jgi:hypothetical protein
MFRVLESEFVSTIIAKTNETHAMKSFISSVLLRSRWFHFLVTVTVTMRNLLVMLPDRPMIETHGAIAKGVNGTRNTKSA